MQLSLTFGEQPGPPRQEPARDVLVLGRRQWAVTYVRHRRARHYVLRVADDGSLRVTIPRGGSRKDAERFAKHKADWIDREQYRRAMTRANPGLWRDGSPVLLRGEECRLRIDTLAGVVWIGDEAVPYAGDATRTVHDAVTERLRRIAERELPARLTELAASLGHHVSRITVRDQRSRWGSCSPAGRISLNWRLVQLPPSVRDYVLLHELTHLVESNHSDRFWAKLEAVCPWQREARGWLRTRFSGTMSDPRSPHPPTAPASPDAHARPA